MWQFEGCDYVVSRVTGGCRGWGFTREINETKRLVCTILQCVHVFVLKLIHQ